MLGEVIALAHIIEAAKSGRAACRTCKQPIAKGELRLGEEVPNQFAGGETTHVWHHLACAAKKRPAALLAALHDATIDVPNRAELETAAAASSSSDKPSAFPYAERAPTGRSSCLACHQAIAKGELRVAVERDVDTGSFAGRGTGYLHPACASGYTGDDAAALYAKLKANSTGLSADDADHLRTALAA